MKIPCAILTKAALARTAPVDGRGTSCEPEMDPVLLLLD
jgi:hypothetical protein